MTDSSSTSTTEDKESLNVLMISHLFPPETGGVQRLAEQLAINTRHEITVLASPTNEPDWDNRYDFPVHRYPLTGIPGLFIQFFIVAWLSIRTDVVYFTRPEYAFFGAPARILGKPVVTHAHGSELYANDKLLHKTYLRLSKRVVTRFIAISAWTRDRLLDLGVPREKISVLHNGVDFNRFHTSISDVSSPIEKESPSLLTVGRIVERKGHTHVIRALPDINQAAEYFVVGPGDSEPLREVAAEEEVINQVHFVGKIPEEELIKYYQQADVFVMPAELIDGDIEGFGLVYLEANAAGTPAVGSNVGGVPSAIQDGVTGEICEPTQKSVANSINNILEDDEYRESLSEAAITWASEHDWSNVAATWSDMIEKETLLMKN